jgi:hypothetical protein
MRKQLQAFLKKWFRKNFPGAADNEVSNIVPKTGVVFERSWMKTMETANHQMTGTDKDECERLSQLADRLIQDKKEMEKEFKEILAAIADDIESRENLGQLIKKQEAAGLKAAGLSIESISAGQEEQKKLIEQKDRTINELRTKLTRLQNSKLGKLQMKYWELKRRK